MEQQQESQIFLNIFIDQTICKSLSSQSIAIQRKASLKWRHFTQKELCVFSTSFRGFASIFLDFWAFGFLSFLSFWVFMFFIAVGNP